MINPEDLKKAIEDSIWLKSDLEKLQQKCGKSEADQRLSIRLDIAITQLRSTIHQLSEYLGGL